MYLYSRTKIINIKVFFTRILTTFIILMLPALVMAQPASDYTILLNSGKFIPEANINTVKKSDEVFQQSQFGNSHYVTIQFYKLPDQAIRYGLAEAGIRLIDYIPNLAYTAAVPAGLNTARLKQFPIRSIFLLNIVQKTSTPVFRGEVPAHAVKKTGYADVVVITYEKLKADLIAANLAELDAQILEEMPDYRSFTLRVNRNNLPRLAGLPFVQWVEFIDEPLQQENLLGRTLHRVNVLNDGVRNLKGDGINIGIWDGGEVSPHLDFSPAGRLNIIEVSSASSHATHVAGTIGSRGLIDSRARGMAPNATIYSYDFNGNVQTEMATAIPTYNLLVSSHSYGGSVSSCDINGAQIQYSATSRATDLNLNNFPTHLHVHSAGNSQGSCPGGWYTITGSGKTAKNNLLCANITTAEALSGSSSCGPTQDGRIKPEISSFGTSVYSTYLPLNSYGTISGTSMSTPGVSGSSILLYQRYKQLNSNNNPPSSLIKNTICNTAQDLGNPGPDYRFGFGRINALGAVRILEENRYVVNTIATGATNNVSITVPAGAARLKVMLNWNDPAGAANANPALVNNLDLSVINGATTTLPWVLDPNNPGNNAVRAVDNISNIEQVTIDNPPAGSYTLRVTGTSVPTGPNQQYALTWDIQMPHIEVIYPNGNESFSPGNQETITWNNAGLSSTQTIEFSNNNGASWTTITSGIPASTTRFIWTVPTDNTSTALIRITSGSITDVSDATFKILGAVTGFSGNGSTCNAGEVNFTWNAVPNATHYDIYYLNATGNFALLASNISATTYTATGLTPGASMWFTLRAKNNSTNAESERANAINVTVSSGGGGMGPMGPITGQNNICGNPSGIIYSVAPVSGATSYTWTVPSGAAIASGQGSTSITVNYPPGSTSGNMSVYASNGTCQNTPSNLTITVNPLPSAPTSGGNQNQTVCLPAPIPTLTATANVPPGHTVVWYDAATGGNTVSNPTLSTTGTVTYYAASRHTASGCESTARTAVTLTIITVSQASVSAGGPTTFCQGGSVTLTANNGTSYNWSTGATTQSITVSTSGSYSVTVTTGGCVSTSPPVNVTVNALPTASISANGPLAFCQGGNVVLTASAGTSWQWSNGAVTQSITVSNTGNYSVSVTNANGCSATSATTSVIVSPNLVVTLSAAPYTRLFPGLSTTLTANVTPAGSYNYTWYKDNVQIPGINAPTLSGIDPYKLGSYTVTVTNPTGLACSNTSPALLIADSATTRLFILPNPNRGKFDVLYHSTGNNTYMLNIYDAKGSLVFEKSYAISSPYQRMEVNLALPARKGLYFIVLTGRNNQRLATGKVVIQ
jgi:hypothetical protein